MSGDKYTAVWVSHTSLSDFMHCPRAYYLKNIYKDPSSGHKVKLMAPPLALGQAVHEVIESLSILPTAERFKDSLIEKFHFVWKKVSGKKGGFNSDSVENTYKLRGEEMLLRVMKNPGPLANPAVKIKESLPHFWLSSEKNIILCGKIDWLEYLPEIDSVHIIDFKTSKQEEQNNSLQLLIYHLLVARTQRRPVAKASYWYIGMQDTLTPKTLPDLVDAEQQILEQAIKVKTARQLQHFKCPHGGCNYCTPMEKILSGEAEYVGTDEYKADVYILNKSAHTDESVIL